MPTTRSPLGRYEPIIGVPNPPSVRPGGLVTISVTFNMAANGLDPCECTYNHVLGVQQLQKGSVRVACSPPGPGATVIATPPVGAWGTDVTFVTSPTDSGTMAVFGWNAGNPPLGKIELCTFVVQ